MNNLPAAAPLEARFQLESRDLSARLKLAALNSDTQFVSALHPLAILGLMLAPAYILWAPLLFPVLQAPGTTRWPGVLNVLLPQLIFAISLFYTAAVLMKARQKQRTFSEPNRLTLDADGVTRHTVDSANSVQWRGIRRVTATKDYLGLFFGSGEGFIVPRRAFESEADWQHFVDFADQQWQRAQAATSPIASI